MTIPYKTQSVDTAIASELALFKIWRSWNICEKATYLNHNTQTARSTAWHIAKTTKANQTKSQQIRYFLKKVLDYKDINELEIGEKIEMLGAIEEALIIAEILESLGIPYLVGGSLASGIWGELRYTQDIDLVADLKEHQVEPLIQACSPRFYVNETAIQEAIQLGHSFNLIDHQTGWKIDIFILTQAPFEQSKFQRRQEMTVNEKGEKLVFYTPEDTILQKLLWYRLSRKQSTQQWRDILGIFKLQQSELDFAYLQHWGNLLQLTEDLEQAMRESIALCINVRT